MIRHVTLLIGIAVSITITPENSAILADQFSPVKIDSKSLANVVQVTPNIISGGEPSSEAAFAELKSLGVKTIISVDGAQPLANLARKQHLRYVHLPHAYSGIPRETAIQLTKAIKELPGPIYVHCHHGIHRSPAATAVACVGAGIINRKQGLALLEIAGTSPKYQGLFKAVRSAKKFDVTLLNSTKSNFPEIANVPPLVKAMAEIGKNTELLRETLKENGALPDSHPAFKPAHEALILHEHFTELLRTPEVLKQDKDYLKLMRDAEKYSRDLEIHLSLKNLDDALLERASNTMKNLMQTCTSCHESYR
ncbi:MAG: hypothetical protein ACKVH8_18650 [Pirellulales bacterium]